MQDIGGGHLSVDPAAVQAAGVMVSALGEEIRAGRRYGALAGLGEARSLVEAVETYRAETDDRWGRWQESIESFGRDVCESGRLIAQVDADQAAAWNGLRGQIP